MLGLNARSNDVQAAHAQVDSKSRRLRREHAALEALAKMQKTPVPEASAEADDNAEDTATMIERLKRLSDQRKTLTELDKRGQDLKQLSNVYQRWLGVITAREREVLHQILRSIALMLTAVLVA